jgi:asparagine synthase (glutamine-hydrolysing)
MCGICGTVGRADERELGLMTDAMAHRGPDGRGVVTFEGDPPAGLGHRRLAILDPRLRAQPMSFADRWWITYNGELYNFRELRAQLELRGERFGSDCDTEVLLRLFALDGPAMLEQLNGMFAFAVWDDRTKLFLARDRLGVRLLYLARADGVFGFASELRSSADRRWASTRRRSPTTSRCSGCPIHARISRDEKAPALRVNRPRRVSFVPEEPPSVNGWTQSRTR